MHFHTAHTFQYSQEELKSFLDSIKFMYGYDFTEYAEASVKRRIINFMNIHKVFSLQDLSKMLLKDESMFETFKSCL
jgi:chemotaxis protein methyltransferase CheR